ncbi:ATPase family gene 2 protein homolog A isoform X2 [Lycorma delicatula]|uniref:ATPase family gene 2 protein homolog A isoform X2 n=1 Tax=Lycorma delicatula TaxID=130591 RepID=UPI003F51701A
MSLKAKKSQSSLWYTCETCSCIFNNKDLQEHQSNQCSRDVISDWKLPFIKDGILYSFIEESKHTDVTNVMNDIILLSQSAMQLCQLVIGDYVVVKSKSTDSRDQDSSNSIYCEAKIIWPTTEGSVTSVFYPKQGLELSWGVSCGPAMISKMKSVPIPASMITFKLTRLCDIPEKLETFLIVLHHKLASKVLHINSRIIINFYGKKLKIIIVDIAAVNSDCAINDSEDKIVKLIGDIKLNSSGDNSEVCDNEIDDNIKFYKVVESTKWCLKNDTDIHTHMDIKATTGVLLYGLYGTGKTHLAEALGNSSGAYIVNIRSGDLFGKFYGEAESRLKLLFKEALTNSPSVIIFDDIDTVCPKHGGSDQERRVLATLLASLDSLGGHDVFIIATTSQIDIIDPALRRPGRFDREIELPIPSLADREKILSKMLRSQPHVNEETIREVASISHGYVGADLCAVVAQAFSRATKCDNNTITSDAFNWALMQIKPSAMREVLVEVPNIRWSDVGGQEKLKLQLRQSIEWPINYPDAFTRLGITPPRGILMFGPPGCSKTMIAKALATESKLNFISIKGPELFSKWVGESEKAVRAVFRRARSVAPSIIFLDELDALAGERGQNSGGGTNVQERVLAQLLTELDGVEPLTNVTIIAATNRPDRIDKALLRPGRLDRLVYVPLPDLVTRRQILELQFQKTVVSNEVNIEKLSENLNGYSGAEVVAVCHEAALNALEEDNEATEVKLRHFKYAMKLITPRTPKSLLDLYDNYITL